MGLGIPNKRVVRLQDLKVYENNPRNNVDAVSFVKNSIRDFGYLQPIVVDKDNVIVCGHTRFAALLELVEEGLDFKAIEVVDANSLTDKQIAAYRLADNKVGEIAEWDLARLTEELASLDLDMTLYGFESTDIPILDDDNLLVEEKTQEEFVNIQFGTVKFKVFKSDFDSWLKAFEQVHEKELMEYLLDDLDLLQIKRNYDMKVE